MKKRLLATIMVICMGLCFVACGNDNASGTSTQQDTQTSEQDLAAKNDAAEDTDAQDFGSDETAAGKEKKNNKAKGELSIESLKEYEVSPVSDFEVTLVRDDETYEQIGVAIKDYLGKDDVVVIPAEIDGFKVVEIRDYSFKETDIKAVVIPDSVEVISRGAFLQCEKLEVVVCGKGVKRLEDGAFMMCDALKQVELNEGLEYIGPVVFGCDNLKELTIPESVTEIDATAVKNAITLCVKSGSYAEEFANYWVEESEGVMKVIVVE